MSNYLTVSMKKKTFAILLLLCNLSHLIMNARLMRIRELEYSRFAHAHALFKWAWRVLDSIQGVDHVEPKSNEQARAGVLSARRLLIRGSVDGGGHGGMARDGVCVCVNVNNL